MSNNIIRFINSFLSYLLVVAVVIIVASIAVFIGIKWRKTKDAKNALESTEEVSDSIHKEK